MSKRTHADMIRLLFAPVGVAPLVRFRVAFGIIMLWEVCRYLAYGWINEDFVEPEFFFTYYGFGWVHPWPGHGMTIHFVALGICAAAIALGLCYRMATVLFFLGFTYVFLLDETHYLNHFYLVCLYSFLLIFVPAHKACSLDAKFRPHLRAATAPAWSLWLLRAQICVVYFMGGVAKLSSDWLHGEPMRMWLGQRMDFPLIGRYFEDDWMVFAFSYGGLLFDLLIAPMVMWRRTRWLGFALAGLFNLMNARLFQIGIFPWLSLGATVLLFWENSWLPGQGLTRRESQEGEQQDLPPSVARLSSPQRAGLLVLGGWLAFQILVPLRHLILYPGNPEWTEEGHRFSWRMKLRHKEGTLELLARDPVTGKEWKVPPSDYLTSEQVRYCADHPEMILQLCHHVAERWRAEHRTPLELRASAQASLNGRAKATLIDPEVDLAVQPRTLRHAAWIQPLTVPLKGGGK
jgi:vitamin K-dependent gamma-carboxylase